MPSLNSDSGLNIDDIHRIEQLLPVFNMSEVVSYESCDSALRCYLDTYGFNRMNCHVDYRLGFISFGRYKVATHFWALKSEDSKNGKTVFVSHGLFDHVGLFLDLIETLLSAGYEVLAIDFPGHGLSEGEKAAINSFDEYGEVISGVLEALSGDIKPPMYAVGQSTGCAAILNYVLASHGKAFERLVLLAPLIQPRSWLWVNWSYILFGRFTKNVHRGFTVNSHRKGFPEFLKNFDPLQSPHISVPWVGAMRKWTAAFDSLKNTDCPTLIIQGSEDGTVWWEKNIPRIQNKISDCEVTMVEGGMHHLVKEGDAWQSQVFEKTLAFLKQGF